LVKWLLERVELNDLPQSLVEEEARHVIQDVVQESVRRGVDKDEIEKNREDIFNRAAQSASDRVRMNYVLSRIAEEEKVVVNDEDLDRRVADMAARYGLPPQAMKAELEKRGTLAGLRRGLRLDKTVDLMLAAAILTPE
jgi:trigger factor